MSASKYLHLCDLPEDMQVLVEQFLESSCERDITSQLTTIRLKLRHIPIAAFPAAPIVTDNRDFEYARRMIGMTLPPIVVCGNQWLDGRHRVWALRFTSTTHVTGIDLAEFIGEYRFPHIGTLQTEKKGNAI